MKTVTIQHPVAEVLALLEQAHDEDIVVRLADGREFILAAVDDFDEEIAQTRKHAALMALLEERAKERATVSLDSLKHELGLAESA